MSHSALPFTSALSTVLVHFADVFGVYTPELQRLRCCTLLQCLGDGVVHDAYVLPDLAARCAVQQTAPSFSIASCKTVRASSRRSRLFSSRILLISIATIAGFIEIFCIVARFPTHPVLGLIDCLIFSDPHSFCKSQKLHRRLLLKR